MLHFSVLCFIGSVEKNVIMKEKQKNCFRHCKEQATFSDPILKRTPSVTTLEFFRHILRAVKVQEEERQG